MSTLFAIQSEAYFRANSLGPEVMAVRSEKLAGRVIAVLRDAVYLGCDDGRIISIVGGEIDGPLTLRVDEVAPLLRALKTQPGATFRATKEMLHIADIASIEWARIGVWTATLPQALGSCDARKRAIHALAGAIADVGPLEGCSSVVVQFVEARRAVPLRTNFPPNAISTRIKASLSKTYTAIQTDNWAEAANALTTLIGLGPGLTPSGDDMLAGITASLVWQEQLGAAPFELTRTLVDAVRQMAPTRTNRISARLLWHACEGVLYTPAMSLGAALLSGEVGAILPNTRQLFAIGHTTGVDLASGLLFGSILTGKLAR